MRYGSSYDEKLAVFPVCVIRRIFSRNGLLLGGQISLSCKAFNDCLATGRLQPYFQSKGLVSVKKKAKDWLDTKRSLGDH